MMNPTPEQLLEKAKEMRSQKGYVDVVNLAREFDVDVVGVERPVAGDGYNAQITFDRESGKYTMYVNGAHSIARQRFSIAHELAHLVLHGSQLRTLGALGRAGSSELEKEADQFAAELLMPEEAVREYFDVLNVNPDRIDARLIKTLAEHFKVSKEVAIIRLRTLDYYVPYIQLD